MPGRPRCKVKRARRANRQIAARRRQRQIKANISNSDRLAFRLDEFAALIGVSITTLWRRVNAGQIKVIDLGATRVIARSEAQRLGLIQP
jgi:hypothetical protein